MTAGGKREGAGRKPLPAEDRKVGVTMRVHPSIAAKWAEYCANRAKSQAVAFAEYVKRLRP